jgi:hypothetical protein
LITHTPGGSFLECVEPPAFGGSQELGRIEHEDQAARLVEVDHASYEPRDLLGEHGRRLYRILEHTQHARHGIDDQTGAMTLRAHDDETPTLGILGGRHVEPTALIDDGQDVAAQVHDAFEELGGLRQAGNLGRELADLVDGLDRQPELVATQPEHEERLLPLPRRRQRLALDGAGMIAESPHDILPE